IRADSHLEATAMQEATAVPGIREKEAPDAELITRERVGIPIPVIKVAHEVQRAGRRRPLPVPDARPSSLLPPVEAEVVMALADRPEEAAVGVDAGPGGAVSRVPLVKPVRVRLQPRIE